MTKFLTIVLTVFTNSVIGQTNITTIDTSKTIYKGLQTKKFYGLGYSSKTEQGITTYKINDQEVDETTYNKYYSTWDNMATCKPCILETYDYYDKLLSKGIQYTDCSVGYEIDYYPNGKVKVVRHYKENNSGLWDSAYDRGFCSRKDGAWTYFNENSEQLYSEFWKDGVFIKQVPEQAKTELWTVELTYNGVKVDKQVFTPEQVKEIKVTPKFKNSSTEGTNLSIKFQVSAEGYKIITRTFTIDYFNTIDIKSMATEAGIPLTEQITCEMDILNNGRHYMARWLKIKLD